MTLVGLAWLDLHYKWVAAGSSAGLIVPSAVLPESAQPNEVNILLNPSYPEFLSLLQNPIVTAFDFDARIATLIG